MSGAVSFRVGKSGHSIHRRSVLADSQHLLQVCARDRRFSPTDLPLPVPGDLRLSLPITSLQVLRLQPCQSSMASDAIKQITRTNRTSIGSNTSPSNRRFHRQSRPLMETTNKPSHATTPPPFARFLPNSVSVEPVYCLAAEIGVLEVEIVRRTMEGT